MEVGSERDVTEDVNPVDVVEETSIDTETQNNYRTWRKNTPFLYDFLSTSSLLWPSLTVQFFPDLEFPLPKDYDPSYSIERQREASISEREISYQRLLHGTFTLGQATDSLTIVQVPFTKFIKKNLNIDKMTFNQDKEEFELNTASKEKISVSQKINHLGDVNKLRYMPQNPDVIASCNNMGDLVIYNRTKHANFKNTVIGEDININKPELRLVNEAQHSASEIFAIDWNKQKEGAIVSANMEGEINLFDIQKGFTSIENDIVNQEYYLSNNGVGVNDIEWMSNHDSIFSVADDTGCLKVYDIRQETPLVLSNQQQSSINGLSINPTNNLCISTGDSKGIINIWDMRNLRSENAESIKTIVAHSDSITQIKWHPKFSNLLGSCSSDKLVKLFDVGKDEKNLIFVHGGHMLNVNDFDWSLHEDWLIASVADDNSLHVWRPSESIIRKFKSN